MTIAGPGRLFCIKAQALGILSSSLEILLRYLGAQRLIITGITGNFCIYFAANDAYMRDYEIIVPADCTISKTAKENREALRSMKRYLKADIRSSSRLSFRKKALVTKD